MPRLSVVVPAHDEERTIGRLLAALVAGDPDRELDIVVVANGCTDGTADVARAVAERIRVVEIAEASKIAALNAGDAASEVFPRAYVDADTEVDATALLALADRLGDRLGDPDVVATGAPRMRVDTTGASLASRMYHRIWVQTPYVQAGPIGCGVYVLSRAARARFDTFPPVIADDLYVERLAQDGLRIIDDDHTFVFHAPRTTGALLARLTRATLGNLQLEQELGLRPGTGAPGGLVSRIARRPALWPAFVVYVALRATAQRRARRRLAAGELSWSRDDSTR